MRWLVVLIILCVTSQAYPAMVVCINDKTANTTQEIDDIVCVLPDSHSFSDTEKVKFRIIQIPGTVDEVSQKLKVETNIVGDKTYWKALDGKWYEVKEDYKFKLSIKNLIEPFIADDIVNKLDTSINKEVLCPR